MEDVITMHTDDCLESDNNSDTDMEILNDNEKVDNCHTDSQYDWNSDTVVPFSSPSSPIDVQNDIETQEDCLVGYINNVVEKSEIVTQRKVKKNFANNRSWKLLTHDLLQFNKVLIIDLQFALYRGSYVPLECCLQEIFISRENLQIDFGEFQHYRIDNHIPISSVDLKSYNYNRFLYNKVYGLDWGIVEPLHVYNSDGISVVSISKMEKILISQADTCDGFLSRGRQKITYLEKLFKKKGSILPTLVQFNNNFDIYFDKPCILHRAIGDSRVVPRCSRTNVRFIATRISNMAIFRK